MGIPTFTPGYPPDGASLGQTKAVIRDNLDGTFQTLNVDHINNNGQPGGNPAGYHRVIHTVPQTGNVPAVAGTYGNLITGVPSTFTINGGATEAIPDAVEPQLYYLTSPGGTWNQMTGNSLHTNGYGYSAGILFQWGTFTAPGGNWPSSSQALVFNVDFPNTCFNVQITLNATSSTSSDGDVFVNNVSITNHQFVWRNNFGSATDVTGFYWMAIGW